MLKEIHFPSLCLNFFFVVPKLYLAASNWMCLFKNFNNSFVFRCENFQGTKLHNYFTRIAKFVHH
jgi:hypothetical protein